MHKGSKYRLLNCRVYANIYCYSRVYANIDCYSRVYAKIDCYSRVYANIDCYSRIGSAKIDCFNRVYENIYIAQVQVHNEMKTLIIHIICGFLKSKFAYFLSMSMSSFTVIYRNQIFTRNFAHKKQKCFLVNNSLFYDKMPLFIT